MTGFSDQATGDRLFEWDGLTWHAAADLYPAIAEIDDWWFLAANAPDDLWMLSFDYFEARQLAHFDGSDWTVLPTPPTLHGWGLGPDLLAPADDGLFIHDGIRLWRYEYCPN
ncbi:hypothetical protein ACNOYE_36320 [Nannocystaceae bacterium ST9]